jgi:copper chaperone CopZ
MTPTESTMRALDYVREVYGVRGIRFNEAARTVRVEYDATRLNEATIFALLRQTGLEIAGKVALS